MSHAFWTAAGILAVGFGCFLFALDMFRKVRRLAGLSPASDRRTQIEARHARCLMGTAFAQKSVKVVAEADPNDDDTWNRFEHVFGGSHKGVEAACEFETAYRDHSSAFEEETILFARPARPAAARVYLTLSEGGIFQFPLEVLFMGLRRLDAGPGLRAWGKPREEAELALKRLLPLARKALELRAGEAEVVLELKSDELSLRFVQALSREKLRALLDAQCELARTL